MKGKLIIPNNDPIETIYEGTIPIIFKKGDQKMNKKQIPKEIIIFSVNDMW